MIKTAIASAAIAATAFTGVGLVSAESDDEVMIPDTNINVCTQDAETVDELLDDLGLDVGLRLSIRVKIDDQELLDLKAKCKKDESDGDGDKDESDKESTSTTTTTTTRTQVRVVPSGYPETGGE